MLVMFIIVIAATIVLLINGMTNSDMDGFCNGMVFIICAIIALILGCIMWGKPSPQPIDVYRNKTTLQIIYQDSIAVDSVVIWKEKQQ